MSQISGTTSPNTLATGHHGSLSTKGSQLIIAFPAVAGQPDQLRPRCPALRSAGTVGERMGIRYC